VRGCFQAQAGPEDGLTSTELAVLMPAVLLLIMLPVQYGLWYHAKQVADAAAEQGVEAAALPGTSEDDGEVAARDFLARAGNLSNLVVRVSRGTETVVVEVWGDAPRLVPFATWSVASRAESPLERFVPEPLR